MTGPAVDYVSPLPPVRSGIADYSVDLLEELAPLCDLRLVRLPGQEVAPDVRRRYEVVEPAALDPALRLPLYQLGNNVYHEGVRRLALESPGVATVHDLRLHHLLVEATLASGDLDAYVAALGGEHGWEGAAAALPTRWGAHGRARLFEMPAHGSLLLRQRGLLVHSEWGRRFLEEELGERAAGRSLPAIRRVPMPMPAPDPPSRRAAADWRRRLDVPTSAVLLGSFGFQTPIKRTDVLLRTLLEPGMENVHAVVAGEAAPQLDLAALIGDLGIQDRVAVTGFLDEADFPVAIAGCDLCLNLRYPSAGETSASLLRILALGRPAVVSDYGQFADLPDAVAVKGAARRRTWSGGGGARRSAAPAVGGARPVGEDGRRRPFLHRARAPAREGGGGRRGGPRGVGRRSDAGAARASAAPAVAAHVVDLGLVAGPDRSRRPRTTLGGERTARTEDRGHEHRLRHLAVGPPRRRRRRARAQAPERRARSVQGQAVDSPCPRDLAPGETCRIGLKLRKPIGPARLRLEPHLFGGGAMIRCGARAFDREL